MISNLRHLRLNLTFSIVNISLNWMHATSCKYRPTYDSPTVVNGNSYAHLLFFCINLPNINKIDSGSKTVIAQTTRGWILLKHSAYHNARQLTKYLRKYRQSHQNSPLYLQDVATLSYKVDENRHNWWVQGDRALRSANYLAMWSLIRAF